MNAKQIIEIGKRLYKKNLTVSTSGNISFKKGGRIYITAAGSALGYLKSKDIVTIDENGKEISKGKASSEKMLHTEIYKQRPDIQAIIHAHPVYLTTFAVCRQKLDEPVMSENILYFEDIPVAEYAMPSSKELVENTIKYLHSRDVVLMANHGALAIADNLEHAFFKLETAEYYAQITLNTKILGTAQYLSPNEINDLLKLKKSAV